PGWFYLGAAALMLSLATKENAFIFGFIGLLFIVETILWERTRRRNQFWLYLGSAAISIALLALAALLNRPPAEGAETEAVTGAAKLILALVTVVGGTLPLMLLSATLIRSRHPEPSTVEEALGSLDWRHWLTAIVIMFVIYILLFTTFFTSPEGIAGMVTSITYWLAQQEVQRGGQPWYYYLLLLPMYEFVPLLFSLIATAYYLVRGWFFPPEIRIVVSPDSQAKGAKEAGAALDRLFIAFLLFWTWSTLFIYSWAGEKMPWLVVHPVLPMIILTAKFGGDLFATVDWREIWRRGGALLALLLPITLFGLLTLVSKQPFQGMSLAKLQETGGWFAALIITILLLVLVVMLIRRLGNRNAGMVALATLLIFLSFFTVRFAWMAAYINYDYATELLVYAHGGADVKPTMNEIAEISARTVGDKMIKVAYDSDVSWPLEWYMREYPNRQFYGETPTREKLDAPVVLAGDKNDAKVQPFLGDRYYRFKRRLVWWPNQQYMDLTWQRIWDILTTPEKRKILWDILYFRKYPRTPDDWYHVHNFYFYVRKDVAQQLWDFGATPPEAFELPPDPYVEKHQDLTAIRTWGAVGTEPGFFNHPRGIAIGPEGNVYVVDSDNHRIEVFDAEGNFLRTWGSQCNLAEGIGCTAPGGAGQFQEPWGIAVAEDGRVYVADTWNHRIQVFDAEGNFLTAWGRYGETNSDPNIFYGPRDVAIDGERLFVTDTGNERIVVFDLEGNYLSQWGSEGTLAGYFAEPVGLDVDGDGNLYVADTWNQRVQVFDRNYIFAHAWAVDAWYGESVVNKPYLAVDGQGRVYITDPEGYRVAVFDGEGNLLLTFGRYGFDDQSFSLPTGIAVDAAGNIYITDTDGQRVMKFAPLP
ncbi:MAG TPA: hypothetical protein ENJ31_11760, partial [Anaerolineae bacterium]|nr:hypothetical protein [Anaerolineae bacterium]